jgi:8-oxo-dGTP pyrophosphatase MutT (NUDIX family)
MTSLPAAAVAIIRVSYPEDSVLLLRRNRNPSDPWSGHFSFPGGRKDTSDPSLLATCTRETLEETGIVLPHGSIRAELEPRVAGSRVNSLILVAPFLFHLEERPQLILDPREIQSSCWLNIDHFQRPEHHVHAEVLPDRYFPAYPIDDYYLWGFTYGLLQSLLEMEAQPELQRL